MTVALRTSRIDAALAEMMNAVRDDGISIIPINSRTKRPAGNLLPVDDEGDGVWKPFQAEIVDLDTMNRWLNSGLKAFAVVGGAVSGGLLVIDFDSVRCYEAWMHRVGNLADGLPIQRTGGGGYQIMLRCEEPAGNQKLAWVADEKKQAGRSIAIETRGEGGYAVLAPSLHPSGKRYEVIRGDFAGIPTLSQAHADALVYAARKLDEAPMTRQQLDKGKKATAKSDGYRGQMNGQASVIDEYNKRFGITDVLIRNGYRKVGDRLIRPDADETSEPGVQVFERNGDHLKVSYHWSSNDLLNDGHAHDAFSAFCELEHSGDYREAVKSAADAMGLKKPPPTFESVKAGLHGPAPLLDGEAPPAVVDFDPADELQSYMGSIVDGSVYAVPWAYPHLSSITRALLPGTTTCVVGDPGVGKTFFILDNILHWYGAGYNPAVLFIEKDRRFHTMRLLAQLEGRGEFVDFEWIKSHGAEVDDAMGRHGKLISEIGGCFHSPAGQRVTLDYVAKWATRMASTGHRVLVVDPITAAFAGDKRWEKDDEFVIGCEAAMAKHNASLVVINHSRKGNRQGAASMHDMALGSAFMKFSDTIIWIAKAKKPRKVRVVGTHGAFVGKFDLFFQIQKARNGKGTNWELAYTFGEGLRFVEQGVVTKEEPEEDGA